MNYSPPKAKHVPEMCPKVHPISWNVWNLEVEFIRVGSGIQVKELLGFVVALSWFSLFQTSQVRGCSKFGRIVFRFELFLLKIKENFSCGKKRRKFEKKKNIFCEKGKLLRKKSLYFKVRIL